MPRLVAIGINTQRAVALGQFGSVRSVDQRDVGIDRVLPAAFHSMHRADDGELAEGVVEVIVAADDVGYAHVMVIDHDGEHVGRRAV